MNVTPHVPEAEEQADTAQIMWPTVMYDSGGGNGAGLPPVAEMTDDRDRGWAIALVALALAVFLAGLAVGILMSTGCP